MMNNNQPSKPVDTPFTTEDTVIEGLPFRQSMCLERPFFPQFVRSTTYTYSYEVYIQGAAASNMISNNIAAQQDIVDTYLIGPLHDIVTRFFMDCNYEHEAEDPTDSDSSYLWVLESSPQTVDIGGKTCRGINTFPSDYTCFVVNAFERIYVYDLSSQRRTQRQLRRHLQQSMISAEEEFADNIKTFLQNQMGLGTFNNLAAPSYSSTRIVYRNGDDGGGGDVEEDYDNDGSYSSLNDGIARPTKPPTPTAEIAVFAPTSSPSTMISPTIFFDDDSGGSGGTLDFIGNENGNSNTLEDNNDGSEGLSVIAFSSLVAAVSFVALLLIGGVAFLVCRRRRNTNQQQQTQSSQKSRRPKHSSNVAMKQYIQKADLEILQEVTATMTATADLNDDSKNVLGIDLVRENTISTDITTTEDKSAEDNNDDASSSPKSKTSTTSSKQKRKSNKSYWSL